MDHGHIKVVRDVQLLKVEVLVDDCDELELNALNLMHVASLLMEPHNIRN